MAMKLGTRPIGSTTTASVTSAEMRNSSGIKLRVAARLHGGQIGAKTREIGAGAA